MSEDIHKKTGAAEHKLYSIIHKRCDISYYDMRKEPGMTARPLLTILNGIYNELEKE